MCPKTSSNKTQNSRWTSSMIKEYKEYKTATNEALQPCLPANYRIMTLRDLKRRCSEGFARLVPERQKDVLRSMETAIERRERFSRDYFPEGGPYHTSHAPFVKLLRQLVLEYMKVDMRPIGGRQRTRYKGLVDDRPCISDETESVNTPDVTATYEEMMRSEFILFLKMLETLIDEIFSLWTGPFALSSIVVVSIQKLSEIRHLIISSPFTDFPWLEEGGQILQSLHDWLMENSSEVPLWQQLVVVKQKKLKSMLDICQGKCQEGGFDVFSWPWPFKDLMGSNSSEIDYERWPLHCLVVAYVFDRLHLRKKSAALEIIRCSLVMKVEELHHMALSYFSVNRASLEDKFRQHFARIRTMELINTSKNMFLLGYIAYFLDEMLIRQTRTLVSLNLVFIQFVFILWRRKFDYKSWTMDPDLLAFITDKRFVPYIYASGSIPNRHLKDKEVDEWCYTSDKKTREILSRRKDAVEPLTPPFVELQGNAKAALRRGRDRYGKDQDMLQIVSAELKVSPYANIETALLAALGRINGKKYIGNFAERMSCATIDLLTMRSDPIKCNELIDCVEQIFIRELDPIVDMRQVMSERNKSLQGTEKQSGNATYVLLPQE